MLKQTVQMRYRFEKKEAELSTLSADITLQKDKAQLKWRKVLSTAGDVQKAKTVKLSL
jgi:hypothetical protein